MNLAQFTTGTPGDQLVQLLEGLTRSIEISGATTRHRLKVGPGDGEILVDVGVDGYIHKIWTEIDNDGTYASILESLEELFGDDNE